MSLTLYMPGQRVVLALVADTHGGHRFGLTSPHAQLQDLIEQAPYQPSLNLPQQRLWDWYTADVAGVLDLAGLDPLGVIHVGDPTQGNRFVSDLAVTEGHAQVEIARANLEPYEAARNLHWLRFVAGTEVHEFGEGTAVALLAQLLRLRLPHVDTAAYYHLALTLAGVTLDLAHHGPHYGTRQWLRGNVLRLYVQSIMQAALENGNSPPDVVARGHYHTYTREVVTKRARERTWQTHGIILPAYCYPGAHGRKAAQSPPTASIGQVALEIVGGRIVGVHEFVRTIDFRTREVIG